jgi:glycosyltransferase A (GT-A) superfamily protein (DUF2064 family)
MTRRLVAVFARPVTELTASRLAPPGVDDDALALAMVEDVVDLVSGMQAVEPVLVITAGFTAARETVWPGTPVIEVPPGARLVDVVERVASLDADEVTVVAGDAPDLPPLLLGKLHSALTTAEVAVCPADGGGLVAFAVGATPPAWVATVSPGMDDSEVLDALRRVAPRRALSVGPGWHRIRAPYDVGRLDPGLEGWDATRALLSSG